MGEEKDEKSVVARVPVDMHTEARVKAVREGRSLADVVRNLLERWLKGEVTLTVPDDTQPAENSAEAR